MTLRRGVHARRRRRRGGLVAILLTCSITPVSAQIATDQAAQERTLISRKEIDSAIADSRFHLGPVRLSPEISIREATYDNNVSGTEENPQGDFRVTVSAGVGLILPVTPNVFIRAGIFPAYTWYAELTERRFFGGTAGSSFIIFANRLTLGGRAGISKSEAIFSSEVQDRVISTVGTVGLSAEFRVLKRFFIFGEGQVQRFQYTGPGAETVQFDPTTTDRTSELVRAGLGYRWSENVSLALGYEETRGEFVYTPEQYDNSTKAIIASISYSRPRFSLSFSGGYREVQPLHGSAVPPFSGMTGSSGVSFKVLRRLDLQATATRNLTVGIESPYYVATRYRVGLALGTGWRLTLQGYLGSGTDEYATPVQVPGGQLVDRVDDVTSYGGGVDFLFSPRIQMRFNATNDRYNSNVPGYDRSFFRWFVSLNVGGNLLR